MKIYFVKLNILEKTLTPVNNILISNSKIRENRSDTDFIYKILNHFYYEVRPSNVDIIIPTTSLVNKALLLEIKKLY